MKFLNADDAWLWFIAWENQDDEEFIIDFEWPCMPIDIYIAVTDLHKREEITAMQIDVLRIFGRNGYVPDVKVRPGNTAYVRKLRGDANGRDERYAHKQWYAAMSVIEPELKKRGIVDT